MTDDCEGEISQGDTIRFTPCGIDRDSRKGTVFAVHTNDLHGTIAHVRDNSGVRYQLSVEVLERV